MLRHVESRSTINDIDDRGGREPLGDPVGGQRTDRIERGVARAIRQGNDEYA